MLESQILSVSLASGIDTKTDPKQVQGSYLLITNAIYKTVQELQPRLGYAALTTNSNLPNTNSPIANGVALSVINDSLLLHDGSNAFAYSPEETTWSKVGQKAATSQSLIPVGSGAGFNQCAPSVAKASNGYELYVWTRKGNVATGVVGGLIFYTVYDSISQTVVSSGDLTAAATNAVALCVGSNFFIVATALSPGPVASIYVYKQPVSQPKFGSVTPTTIDTGVSVFNNSAQVDACASSTTLYILMNNIYAVDATTLAVTSTTPNGHTAQPIAGIAFDSSTNQLWFASASSGSDIAFTLYDAALNAINGPQNSSYGITIAGSALCISAFNGTCYIAVSTDFSYFGTLLLANFNVTNPGNFAFVNNPFGCNAQVMSRPFSIGDGFTYFFAGYFTDDDTSTFVSPDAWDPIEPTTFLLKIPTPAFGTTPSVNPVVVLKSLPLNTGPFYYVFNLSGSNQPIIQFTTPPYVLTDSFDDGYIFPNFLVVGLGTAAINSSSSTPIPISVTTSLQRLSFSFDNKLDSQLLAKNMHTSGGYISSYDQSKEVEHGFHIFPTIANINQGSLSSGGWTTGTYSFVAVYSWVDALGQIQRSAPSAPVQSVVASGNKSLTFTTQALILTDKINVNTEIYGTLAGGTIYYFIASYPATSSNSSAYEFGPAITLQIYTSGGQVDNISAPASNYLTSYKNRLWSVPAETPNTLWYSQQVVPGSPVEFSDLLTQNIDERGGPTTALAAMDDKLIIFKESALFFMVGDGPAPSGANNDFTPAQNIPTDSGCTEPSSVVLTPAGVIYKGKIGIYMLDRSLNVRYIGAPVEAYNQYKVTSALLDPNTTQVRLTLSNGMALMYDYFVEKWAVFTNINAIDSVSWLGNYAYLTLSGVVNPETPGAYSDNGSVIPMGFTTSWISLAKVQGFERIKKLLLLGQVFSANTLSLSFAYNFDTTIFQTIDIPNNSVINPWQYRVFPKRQKCESLQLTFLITPSDTSGESLTLSNILIEAGIKKGPFKLSAAKSVG